jgi:aminoglycoside phosphotransferase (APT) family kinase protein
LAAEALADLHQTPIEGLSRHTAADDHAKLTSRARVLAEFHPSLDEPVRRVASRLAESAIFSDFSLVVPLHGDFNDGQILFHNDRPIVLDFDACALGDPHYDLGHFIAALFRLVDNRTMSESDLRSAEAEFQRAYQANVSWHVSQTRLRHFIALALICRRAHKALRRLEPNAIESIQTFVAHAEAYLVS